ncbi:RNA-binding domain-containing protein [Sistotremastrum niveocremeum HHB9708]|uniref:RNA-binding domain-containing protein n=2 Tax=Sistotremastraceae TaxID=3402574 RepID=A0A165ALQ6_9AGAM|nr:RNA-binding domain-containing protein [Sistotremastrum niveocremeum HHB9708]KZT42058.1 RNA-binding domain-containing protein [Sistotremastrum suecicum HHB10207 ss-3]
MEEGTRTKKTVFVGNLGEEVNESHLYETFSTFGDIIDVQLPSSATNPNLAAEAKHRGFAFVTFAAVSDAQDAIDNMDMNEFHEKVIRCNLAKPSKQPVQGGGNRAVWESEDWLKTYAKPLHQSGGVRPQAAIQEGEKSANPETEEGEEAMDDS